MGLTLNHFLVLGAVLFCIGLYGAISKHNAIAVLMGIEIMLNAVNVTMIGFSFFNTVNVHRPDGFGQLQSVPDWSDFRYFHYHCCGGRGSGRPGDDYCHLPQAEYSGCWRD